MISTRRLDGPDICLVIQFANVIALLLLIMTYLNTLIHSRTFPCQ